MVNEKSSTKSSTKSLNNPFTLQLANGKTQSFPDGASMAAWYYKHTPVQPSKTQKQHAGDSKGVSK